MAVSFLVKHDLSELGISIIIIWDARVEFLFAQLKCDSVATEQNVVKNEELEFTCIG